MRALGGRVGRLLGAYGSHAAGFADQLLVSATAFAMLAALGRWSSLAELGLYAVAASALAVLLAIQEALVARPYYVLLNRPADGGCPTRGAFALGVIFAALCAAGFALGALGLAAAGAEAATITLALCLCVAAPAVLVRDFLRRYFFGVLQTGSAMRLDAAVAALQVALLCALVLADRLTAAAAILVVGLSCALGAGGGLWLRRRELNAGRLAVRTAAARSWSIGRWMAGAYLAMQVQGYAVHWMTAYTLGAAATGAYAACVSLIALANPLVFGAVNVMAPRSAREFSRESSAGVCRLAVRDASLLAVLMGAFCVAVALAGDPVLRFLFPGTRGDVHGLLVLLALGSAFGAVGVPASIALTSMGYASAMALVATAGSLASVALAAVLLTTSGLPGAVFGLLVGEMLGAAARWAALLRLAPAPRPTPLPASECTP